MQKIIGAKKYGDNSLNFFVCPIDVKVGDNVKAGDKLIEVDLKTVKDAGYSTDIMVIVLEESELPKINYETWKLALAGKTVVAQY